MSMSVSSGTFDTFSKQTFMFGFASETDIPAGAEIFISINGVESYRQTVPESKAWDLSVKLSITEKEV